MRKEAAAQSFMNWKFERCNCEQLVDLLMEHLGSVAEHDFMASWNYVQYKEAKKNITVGDVILVLTLHKITCANIRMKCKGYTGGTSKYAHCSQFQM